MIYLIIVVGIVGLLLGLAVGALVALWVTLHP